MKKVIITGIATLTLISSVFAGTIYLQDGYYRSNGTYVQPHLKTTPDAYKWNNLSYYK